MEQTEEVEQRVRDEEPAFLIGSPKCRAFSTLIELTRVASKLSEVKYRNLVERCIKRLKFCFRMYETQRNAGRLFLPEHPWDAWSRGLSFVEGWCEQDERWFVPVSVGNEQYREGILFNVEFRVRHRGVDMRCCNGDGQAKNHMKNFVVAGLKGLNREGDSVKAPCSMEVGVTCEEPNVPDLDLCLTASAECVSTPTRRGKLRSTS